MSERRACKAIGCRWMTIRYRSIRPDDAALRDRMRAIARERRRFGYRRLHVTLKREGPTVNHKKLFRLYREEKLSVRRRGGRKRAIGTRAPMLVPLRPNERWSLDFVSDQFTDGRRFRARAIVDDRTRENLALVADTSLSGVRVARELDRLIRERGRPRMIVSDNGSEFTSNAILAWADQARVEWRYIAILRRASPCRTASSRASTLACGMNCTTRRCSHPSATLERFWPSGRRITTAHDPTRNPDGGRWPSSPRPSTRVGSWRCAMRKAPRHRPSHHLPVRANQTPETNSEPDKKVGGNVNACGASAKRRRINPRRRDRRENPRRMAHSYRAVDKHGAPVDFLLTAGAISTPPYASSARR